MPRTSEQNQAIKDKRRARIIKSAIRVFASYGYDQSAIDDITKDANCSHGLFYHYFDNKAVILEAIVDENIRGDDLLPPCRQALAEGGMKGVKTLLDYLNKAYPGTSVHVATGYLAVTLSNIETLPKSLKKTAAEIDVQATLRKLIGDAQKEKKAIAGEPSEIAQGIYNIILANFRNLLINGKTASVVSSDVLYNMVLLGERED